MSNDFEIILVEPKNSGNIGSVARAMMNMGFLKLTLVNPIGHHLNRESLDRALEARMIAEKAKIYQTLEEAVAEAEWVVGTTGKKNIVPNLMSPKENAVQCAHSSGRKVALVFGPEDTGLRKEHFKVCDAMIHIPTSDFFPSINLSHAVIIVLYELFIAQNPNYPVDEKRGLASHEARFRLNQHMEEMLEKIGFLDPQNPERILKDLRRLFSRAELDEREVKILRGIWSQVIRKVT